jgi:predicted TIM-barrel enzyme
MLYVVIERVFVICDLKGSGVTEQNVADYIGANALIVGSYFKKDGYWMNSVEYEKTAKFMETVKKLRQ